MISNIYIVPTCRSCSSLSSDSLWQKFALSIHPPFSVKLYIENAGSPVTSGPNLRKSGNLSFNSSGDKVVYVSKSIIPLHLYIIRVILTKQKSYWKYNDEINSTERSNLDLPIVAWIIVNIKLVILVVPQKTTPGLTSFKMLRIFLSKQSQIVSVAQRLFDLNQLLTYNFTYGMNVSPLSLKKYFPQCLLSNKVNVLNALNGFSFSCKHCKYLEDKFSIFSYLSASLSQSRLHAFCRSL